MKINGQVKLVTSGGKFVGMKFGQDTELEFYSSAVREAKRLPAQ